MTENDENFKKGGDWQKFPRWKFFKFSEEFIGAVSITLNPLIPVKIAKNDRKWRKFQKGEGVTKIPTVEIFQI